MASMLTRSVFFFLILFPFCHVVQGAPKIVLPYPRNLYPIENEKAEVSCVVEDTVSNPDEIVFIRRSRFGDISTIRDEGPSGRRYYQNETLGDGSKLRVTLHFNQIQLQDDSRYERYECRGYSGGSFDPFGFAVNVIEQNELPSIEVSDNVTAKLGDKIVLSCNFTISQAAFATKLTKMMWTKDGRLIEEVLYPKQQPLKSLKIDVERPDVGGIYTCQLISKLKDYWEYNVTDSIYVTVLIPTEGVHVSRKTTTPRMTSSMEFSNMTEAMTTSGPVSSVGKASLTLPIILLGFSLIWLLHV